MYTVIAAIAILKGAQVGVQTTNAIGTNFVSCSPAWELRDTMLGGVHCPNRRAGASTLCYMYTDIAILKGARVGVQTTIALGTNFVSCLPTRELRYTRRAGASPLFQYNSGHSTPILDGAQVGVQTTNTLGTIFCKLPTSQGYHARRYEQTGRSLSIMHSVAICIRGHSTPRVHGPECKRRTH